MSAFFKDSDVTVHETYDRTVEVSLESHRADRCSHVPVQELVNHVGAIQ